MDPRVTKHVLLTRVVGNLHDNMCEITGADDLARLVAATSVFNSELSRYVKRRFEKTGEKISLLDAFTEANTHADQMLELVARELRKKKKKKNEESEKER